MKKDLHPTSYQYVVFSDESAKFKMLTKSTAQSKETIKWEDGNEYPLIKVHISSASHPFYTGEEKIVDVEGRVDRFKAQRAAADKKRDALKNKAKKQNKEQDEKQAPAVQKLGAKPAKPAKAAAPAAKE